MNLASFPGNEARVNLELEAATGERYFVHLVKWLLKKPLRKKLKSLYM